MDIWKFSVVKVEGGTITLVKLKVTTAAGRLLVMGMVMVIILDSWLSIVALLMLDPTTIV